MPIPEHKVQDELALCKHNPTRFSLPPFTKVDFKFEISKKQKLFQNHTKKLFTIKTKSAVVCTASFPRVLYYRDGQCDCCPRIRLCG